MRKLKYLFTFLLLSCFTLMMSAGILSAAGTNNMTSAQSNQSYDNRSINTNSYATTAAGNGNYRANAVNDDNDFDWGWLGLLGLLGLAGLRSRNHDRNPERS
ncbi:WGxxGxxG family protein [Paenibacillus sp. BC26]|uniref:WGxxGxxG family protein n=1 Tax=Paenibacillus sp. BC26 TaxID=1881032 RepID=UPI0008E42E0B|nr:WGxxGxxG family protein [Paenibacillus sp. BC26]SFT05908.1 MYXO-CTERM domain-containing protein [Paenibacillus sp. BC26]